MSLRRFAHFNKGTSTPGSPSVSSEHRSRTSIGTSTQNSSSSVGSPNGHANTPSTPYTPPRRSNVQYINSPSATPSITHSTPFDWDAARARRPPPYATPRRPGSHGTQNGNEPKTPRKSVVRKKGFVERIRAVPSRIAFEIALFPHNVPLPAPRTSAIIIGAGLHVIHLFVRIAQLQAAVEAEIGWEDMYWEKDDDKGWFDWTVPMTVLLMAASAVNVFSLFTRRRTYQLHRRTRADAVQSPRTSFVHAPERAHSPPSPHRAGGQGPANTVLYVLSISWRGVTGSIRFLLGIDSAGAASKSLNTPPGRGEVQQLNIWTPGELERVLIWIYSPVHGLLYMGAGSAGNGNWVWIFAIMAAVSVLIWGLVEGYEGVVRDREILAGEVMYEYNEGFVYPRVNPIRRDVAVMTHENEMVSWK
ncbi:hypothetical protein CONPUDRAFT_135005 [Coniophora puteana RWD-64-598 SS2]|uniref:Uncharacterized protein n=1 Tax=Coniophora puteana (strain RWD-64-598) TaxID=741705 RepID=A0A5M3N2T5_CONPW|nr:uncharacterized protein CONPUDRAFT_135005 [Coniophora puteana RWD-64-598 SS2]EIW85185.1 hypothetical protein CONPUDRAFT_135005 [Coniophora puteana RWD-64-598 SS2]